MQSASNTKAGTNDFSGGYYHSDKTRLPDCRKEVVC